MAKHPARRKSKPLLSIVIPAYNEEKYLPKLLDSINAQDFKNLETIVVIKLSKDKTFNVASRYDCTIKAGGGLPGVSRNMGAKLAKSDVFLFLDADTILPKGFISELMAEFKQKKLACAVVFSKPLSEKLIDKISFFFTNCYIWIFQYIRPSAAGWCIIIKSDTFRKIGGFDESLWNFEDFDLVNRASKQGKFSILPSPQILVSVRRYEKEGRFSYFVKTIWRVVLYALIGKKTVQNKVKYEFGKF
ncbi:MAG: glycosyltransferase [Candidatus Woesearchaeota archaeon]